MGMLTGGRDSAILPSPYGGLPTNPTFSGLTVTGDATIGRLRGSVVDNTFSLATKSFLISDGATSGRGPYWALGAQNLAGQTITKPFEFYVPTSAPTSSTMFVFHIGSFISPLTTDVKLQLYIPNWSGNALYLHQENGASGHRDFYHPTFRTIYAGRYVKGCIVLNGDSASSPVIIVENSDISSSFTLGTSGSVPNWMPSTLVSTYFVAGYNLTSGRFVPHPPILRAWSLAEAQYWTQTGLYPDSDQVTTGSVIAQTSGTLTIGNRYRISAYVAGDSFTNVGAASNATGVEFVATGTTPTTWTNSSSVTKAGPIFKPIIQSIPYIADGGTNGITGIIATGTTPIKESYIGERASITATFAHSAISTSAGTTAVGIRPPGWAVVEVQLNVDVALDTSTTINIGSSGTSNLFVNALAVDSTGLKQADSLSKTPSSLVNSQTIYIRKSGSTTVGNIVTVNVILERKY